MLLSPLRLSERWHHSGPWTGTVVLSALHLSATWKDRFGEGRSLKRIGEQEEGKVWKRNRDSESNTESEREEGRLIYVPTRASAHTHTHTVMPRCDIRELVINGIFTRFHNLLYSFLPSARDLCSHHILAALTWFLWFHICSSADIQDVQFVLLNRLGPRGEVMLKNQYKIQRVSIRRSHGITMKVRRKKLCKGYLHVAGDGRIRNQESSH